MSLIKWSGGDDDRQALVKRVRDLADKREQTVGKKEIVQRDDPYPRAAPSFPAASVVAVNRPSIIELPRYCAVYDELWLAAYEPGQNGEYEFVTSRPMPKHQQGRYSEENVIALPSGFHTDVERCACCQTWTVDGFSGAVWCRRIAGRRGCGARVCCGRVRLHDLYFRCRDSCGATGILRRGEWDINGLVPGRHGGNFGTQF